MRISMKEIWRNSDGPPKNIELWSYVVSFEFSRPKVAQTSRIIQAVYKLNFLKMHVTVPTMCRRLFGSYHHSVELSS